MEIPKLRKSPPLPFQGNKAIGRNKFYNFLNCIDNGNDMIFVDLFGGSFYLSYLVHKVFPNSKIICNDFDDYMLRIKNISKTNNLLEKIKNIIENTKRGEELNDEQRQKIDNLIRNENGYIDFLTLSFNLLYNSNITNERSKFFNKNYINRLIKKPYDDNISDYIEGIDFVKKDWFDLYLEYFNNDNVIFIADPPNIKKFGLVNFLKTIEILKSNYFIYYA